MADFKHGAVMISNEIIDQLVAECALQVEGVNSVVGYKNGKLEKGKKAALLNTEVNENNINVDLTIVADKGANISEVAEKVQEQVAEQVNTMLGFNVEEVNVFVKDIA